LYKSGVIYLYHGGGDLMSSLEQLSSMELWSEYDDGVGMVM
jgi:hypothetical protein